jgi:hypothetical protein
MKLVLITSHNHAIIGTMMAMTSGTTDVDVVANVKP